MAVNSVNRKGGHMDKLSKEDILILRELAIRVAEIAAHPIHEKRRDQWKALNALKPQRPMVWIDQICWHEMNVDNELTIKSQHPVCREYEDILRKTLYRHRHMQADQVVEPYLEVPIVLTGYTTGYVDWQDSFDFGIKVQDETISTDAANDIVSHRYVVQIKEEDDIEKIKMPFLAYDKKRSQEKLAFVQEIFGDSIEVRSRGCYPVFKLWDTLLQWCGIESLLLDMAMKPEYIHALANRLTEAYLSGLDQLESLGVLGGADSLIHCTGAYTDELKPEKDVVKAKEMWTANLCQIFSSVSKSMHEEYEIAYSRKWYQRFGLGYYGCCEPLHDRIDIIRNIPNIRKISISPWADRRIAAEAIGKDFVLSNKPTPAIFAHEHFDNEDVRKDLIATISVCEKTGTPVEFILKDLSTVQYQPQRLWEWSKLAAELTGGDVID